MIPLYPLPCHDHTHPHSPDILYCMLSVGLHHGFGYHVWRELFPSSVSLYNPCYFLTYSVVDWTCRLYHLLDLSTRMSHEFCVLYSVYNVNLQCLKGVKKFLIRQRGIFYKKQCVSVCDCVSVCCAVCVL